MSRMRIEESQSLRLPDMEIDLPHTCESEVLDLYKETMSVREMAKMLGLCKSESYYLVNKRWFKVIPFYKGKRIVIKSFEKWYKSQFRYKKVNGDEPGENYSDTTLSVKQVMSILNCSDSHVYELMATKQFDSMSVYGVPRIDIATFYAWLAEQTKYPLKKGKRNED